MWFDVILITLEVGLLVLMLALRSSMKRLGRKTAWQLAETTRRLREVRAVEKHAAEMLARVNEWTSIEGAESKLRPEDFE